MEAPNVDRDAIARLAHEFTDTVLVAKVQGMSDLEIGAALGIAVGRIAQTKENIFLLAEFACRHIPQEEAMN